VFVEVGAVEKGQTVSVLREVGRYPVQDDADALLVTEMVAGAIFGHHVILGQGSTDAWLDSLIDHLWRAVAAH